MVGSGDRRPFVGRQQESDRVAEALVDALGGRGRLMLIAGEPGIGKTRLADEATTAAAREGVPVLWGRCWESGGAPAYWPWLEVLPPLVRTLDDDTLQQALGDGAGLVSELLPELRARLPNISSPRAPSPSPSPTASMATPEEVRFRMWRSLAAVIRTAAQPKGLVIVLDDLHAADQSSLLLLLFVARELRSMRLLVIGTFRDVEARLEPDAGALLSRVGREGTTLALRRLDREATTTFLRQRAAQVSPDVADRIFHSTQGNPLFIEEMSRLLGDDAPGAAAALMAGVLPEGVRDVIRQRLERLSPEARELLDLASVAGDDLDVDLLAAATGRPTFDISATLALGARAGALVEAQSQSESQSDTRWRFSHALVREVLYRDLAPEVRRAQHGRIGEALARHDDSATPPCAELAHHALEGPAAGLPRAVEYAVRAAQQALERLAYEEAVSCLTRTAAAVAAAGNSPALRAIVLLALADAQIRRGELAAGKTACREVATLARKLGDADLLARAALTYGRVFTFAVVDPILVGMLEEALEAQPPGDSALRVRLLARLGGALQPARLTDEPVRVAREAIAGARRLGDQATLLDALYDALAALMDIVHPRERQALNLEVERMATAVGDRERVLRTHGRLVIDHTELGELGAADARIAAFETLATELAAPWILWRAPLFKAMRALMHGRFDEASALAEQAQQIGRQAGDPQVDRCTMFHREGFLRAAERHADMLALDPAVRGERAVLFCGPAWQSMGSALVASRMEDAEATRQHLDVIPEDMRPPADNVFGLFFLSEPTAFAGPLELAAKLFDMLLPAADRDVMLGMTQMTWAGPATRLLALLAARLGRWESAWTYFEAAIARAHKLNAGPILARTRYEFARALLARGAPGDLERARPLLGAAHDAAQALQLSGLSRLSAARLATLTPSPAVLSSPPFAMTAEGEYWTLQYEGDTFRLKDSLGLRYLARLLAEPDREIHVLDLVGERDGAPDGPMAPTIDTGDAGELLDGEARDNYRRRLDDLRDTLAEAESFGDTTRAARAREEIDFLAAELGRAVGLGGRARRAGSAAERARSAVQRRIKNALERVSESSPALAAYLAKTVKTGNFCVYRPRAP